MDQSPFRCLAPEIRLIIYELVLVQPARILLPMKYVDLDEYVEELAPHMWDVVSLPAPLNTGLMSVCKEIRAESLPVFYGKNTFLCSTIDDDGWFLGNPAEHLTQVKNLRRWLDMIGSENAALCRRIYMYAGTVQGCQHPVDTAMYQWQMARILEKEIIANAGLSQSCLYDVFVVHFWDESTACLFFGDEDWTLDNWEMIVPVRSPEEILASTSFEPFDSSPSLEILDHCDSHCVHRCEIVERADALLEKLVSSGKFIVWVLKEMEKDIEVHNFISWPACREKAGGTTENKDGRAVDDEKDGGTS